MVSKLAIILVFGFVFFLLGTHPQHMEVPKLRVHLELQLLAYTTVTAMPRLRPTPELMARLGP